MSYCWFNKKKSCKKQRKDILKQKLLILFTKQRSNKRKIKMLVQKLVKEEKDKIKDHQRKRYQQLIQYKKEALQNK